MCSFSSKCFLIFVPFHSPSLENSSIFVEAAERDTAEAEMHQALKALDHHQLQLDLAIEALKAATAEVAEAEGKKKMLEKEHGHLMAHLGRKNMENTCCVGV